MNEIEALTWAQTRKKDNETVEVSHCPCCDALIAVYVAHPARLETVPDTTVAIQELVLAKDDTSHSS